jgi:hypothetical protein
MKKMKNKLSFLIVIAAFFTVFAVLPAMADPIVNLNVLDSNIVVGETFTVQVLLDGNGIDATLLSFGFDVDPSTILNHITYNSSTIGSGFDTDISSGNYVGGSAFLGITDNNVLLATLSFKALSEGTDTLAIKGLFDGTFYGLYYLDDAGKEYDFDINASTDITVKPAGIPEPATMLLLGCGLAGLGVLRKSFRKA